MENWCYLNGEYIKVKDAKVHAYDIGMTRGYGIYEGITTYGKNVFRFQDHMDRFRMSAKALNLKIPHTDQEILTILNELVSKNKFPKTNIRIILTGGDTVNSIEYNPETPTFFVMADPHKRLSEKTYAEGEEMFTYEHQRFLPQLKTINYITAVNLQPIRKEKKAIEILFVSGGKVLEASTSNFFIVKGDTFITSSKNVLFGITRKVALELIQTKFKIEERDVLVSELKDVDESFITATYKEIVPIVKIDEMKIGKGTVGEKTSWLIRAFHEYTNKVDK